jgi:hypothetical protein
MGMAESRGQVQFDNFGGRWGDSKHLDRFLQAYAVEKCHIEARKKLFRKPQEGPQEPV